MFRDLLGFKVIVDQQIPDGEFFAQAPLDDIFKVEGGRSRMVILRSPGGTLLELQQPSVPGSTRTPDDYLRCEATGISELAFAVEDIDGWFERVRDAGYETQTGTSETSEPAVRFCLMTPTVRWIQLGRDQPDRQNAPRSRMLR